MTALFVSRTVRKKAALAVITAGAAVMLCAAPASACVRIAPGPNASWNLRFINTCPYNVIVTWHCAGNCRTGCATNVIRPGGSDNGYCHSGSVNWSFRRW
jgi:hypothetical protein